jgi:hypothetical protein
MNFDLTEAAASRSASGDGVEKVLVPVVILGVAAASWGLRPPSPYSEAARRQPPWTPAVSCRGR